MPSNLSRSAQFFDKEVLAYPQANLLTRSIVIDATTIPQAVGKDARTVVPAGTIMALSATNAKVSTPYTGTGSIQGILTRAVEILASATAANEGAAVFWHEAVFATTAIVSFTQYASALLSTPLINSCKYV